VLPVAWSLLALAVVGGFIAIAAYWLDVQDRPDLSFRARVAWSVGTLLFPVMIPIYAFLGRPGWPRSLRIAAFLPIVALALVAGFVAGLFR
jgi:hypothetical protein